MYAEGKIKSHMNVLSRFFHEHDGTIAPVMVFNAVARSLASEAPMSFAVDMTDPEIIGRSDKDTLCIITPAAPNASQYSLMRNLMFPRLDYDVIPGIRFAPGELQAAISAHESWHCMEQVYSVKITETDDVSFEDFVYRKHKAETFADVGSAMEMMILGYKDTASKIALMRTASSRLNGALAADPDQPGPGPQAHHNHDDFDRHGQDDDWQRYVGAIYYTAPALDLLVRRVETMGGVPALRAMTPEQRMDMVMDITEKGALPRDDFFALHGFLERQSNTAGKESADARPPFVDTYIAATDAAIKRVVKAKAPRSLRGGEMFMQVSQQVQAALFALDKPAAERTTADNRMIDDFEKRRNAVHHQILRRAAAYGATGHRAVMQAVADIKNELRRKMDMDPAQAATHETSLEFLGQLVMNDLLPDASTSHKPRIALRPR